MSQDESNPVKYSSKAATLGALARSVPERRAESFLIELLNLRVRDGAAISRFLQRFDDLLPTHLFLVAEMPSPLVIEADSKMDMLKRVRLQLAEAWCAPTVLAREIALYRLIGVYLYTGEEPRTVDSEFVTYNQKYWAEIEASLVDAFFLVLHRALHVVDRTRYCPNPECPAPYFIAKRRSQKYCSEICALPAQREFKRRWWAEHGEARRKSRQRAKAQTAKTRRKRGK